MAVYNFTVAGEQGQKCPLSVYEGKILLIVNTATHCGFTPQYTELEELQRRYQARGFEVLDFPCNQFARQVPESSQGIAEFCALHYQTSFARFAKVRVNGKGEEPLFGYLKTSVPGALGKAIKWNFTKFLVAPDGVPVKRYAPTTRPSAIARDIETLLEMAGR